MIFDIQVTQDNIDKGRRQKCRKCPVYRAIRDAGFKHHIVSLETLYHQKDPCLLWEPIADLPTRVTWFIDAFDNGRPVKPFTFKLRLSKEQAELLGWKPAKKPAVNKKVVAARKKKAA